MCQARKQFGAVRFNLTLFHILKTLPINSSNNLKRNSCFDFSVAHVVQIAKSVYSGFTASVGGNSIPAATVAFVPCSIKMNEPVSRLVL